VTRGRIEAFSDGVIAIIITIMVLELRPPHGGDAAAVRPMVPQFLSYVLSFVFIGIYWSNHHHLFQAVRHVDGRVLWANLHLLFWLSLVPIVTAWVGEHHVEPWPTALYGCVFLAAAIAYTILAYVLVAVHGPDSAIAKALGADVKGKVSLLLYAASIGLAFVRPWIAQAIFVLVALIWFIPDQRIERALANEHPSRSLE
jgi:uncharacterized membrane protein